MLIWLTGGIYMTDFKQLQDEYFALLIEGDNEGAVKWAEGVLKKGVEATEFFDEILTPTLKIVGDKFSTLDIFLPELINAAEAAKMVSDQVIKPLFIGCNSEDSISRGKAIMCSVQGDLHDIGKNMVSLMLQVNGFDVKDLGINVPPKEIINAAKENKVDLVGLSALMTTSMPYMKEVIEFRNAFVKGDEFSIIVGGAPITDEYSKQIGADAYGEDAVDGVNKCIALMNDRK
jgi:methylmalonyl-CoA mutase cobalamin-binding domain/chain